MMYVCGECGKTFNTLVRGRCPLCFNHTVVKADSVISDFIKNNYRTFENIVMAPVHANGQTVTSLCVRCKSCQTTVSVKSIDELGISVETYTLTILRRLLDKHLSECDGVVKTAKPARSLPLVTKDLPTRKIILE